ncbi:transcriptional regulator, AlpA family [Burkholderia sp. WP9]|jgi:prophage regulatory protein|uniref:helix-turn-helix transcriptional regulator n=1 Tax=Burkholderia sp. WP9 TaxID=1500263 RepID=UPI00089581BF|nr:AlpA family transcriptional regulator [Burkholderia sp. WP9]SEC87586.1 transcriptional regulator, AlpA family [Burkholderia sp. WP9]
MTNPAYRMLRLPEVAKLTSLSRPTIYRWIAAGTFPKPVKLGPNSVAWRSDVVQEWMDARTSTAVAA